MEDQLKKFKKLIDADDLLTNKYRLIIEKEYERLTAQDQMGEIFKCLVVSTFKIFDEE